MRIIGCFVAFCLLAVVSASGVRSRSNNDAAGWEWRLDIEATKSSPDAVINPLRVGDTDFISVAGAAPFIGPDGRLGVVLTVEEEEVTENGQERRPVTKIAVSYQPAKNKADFDRPPRFAAVGSDSVILESAGPSEGYGVSDPIIVYADQQYYMFYMAKPHHPGLDSFVALAVAGTPDHASGWQRMGAVLPQVGDMTSATVSPSNVGKTHPHVMLYSGIKRCGLLAATSSDMLTWDPVSTTPVLTCRQGRFDSHGVLAGPPPMRLSNGEWLWLYTGVDEKGKGHIGAALSTTSMVKDRAAWTARPFHPLMSAAASTPWEADSIRVMGLVRAGNGSQDVFDVYYTGAALESTEPSSVGHARIEVINHRVHVDSPSPERVVQLHSV